MPPPTTPPVKPERTTAWIDEALIQQAKTIAARRAETASEVLERHLRTSMAAEYREVVAEMASELAVPLP